MNNATWISWFYFKYAIMIYNYNIYVNHHINRSILFLPILHFFSVRQPNCPFIFASNIAALTKLSPFECALFFVWDAVPTHHHVLGFFSFFRFHLKICPQRKLFTINPIKLNHSAHYPKLLTVLKITYITVFSFH